MPPRPCEAQHRRLELALLCGFTYHVPRQRWERADGIQLTDYEVDQLEPWASYVAWWLRIRWLNQGRADAIRNRLDRRL
jgi:hypothetical protein